MVSVNVTEFVVLKILHILVFISLCSQITADVSKIMKNVRRELTFIFTELSEIINSFV